MSELLPEDKIVSEENDGSFKLLENKARGGLWIVDPLDNTRGFVKGDDDYAILLTRLQMGLANDAMIVHPARGWVSRVHRGRGAYRNRQLLHVSSNSDVNLVRSIGVYSSGLTKNIIDQPSESTEAFLAVAEGGVDIAFIRMCGHKIWDIAFADLLIREAGGVLTDEHGCPLRITSVDVEHQWLIASNGVLHQFALEYLENKLKSK